MTHDLPAPTVADPGGPARPVAGDRIRDLADRFGDSPLVILGDRRVSYREIERASAELARGLLARGAGKGTRIGLLAPNGPDWIVAWLAGARIGSVVTLLNTYAPPPELSWLLRHSDVSVLLTVDVHLGHDHLDRLEAAVDGLGDQAAGDLWCRSHPYLRAVWVLGDEGRTWARPVEDLRARGAGVDEAFLTAVEAEVTPADPMVVVYSSGSTAEPKGAVHTQGAVLRHGPNLGRFRDLGPGDRVYTPMPLFWVGGLSFALVRVMHAGATLVLEERFEPGATLALLERQRVTHVLGWPHMSPALTARPDFASRDLSALRGGSLPDLLPAGRRPADPGLVPGSLGMTETLGPHLIDHEGIAHGEDKRGSFGRSVPGVEHKVVDPDTGTDAAPGEPGELWVRGDSLMAGLHRRERHEVFTPDGWYRTGDGGHLDADGHFYFTGRLGDLIKSAGMNVAPADVEAALAAQPGVRRAVVVGVPAAERGQDVAAAVVAGPDVTADDLRAALKAELSAYEVPRHVLVLASDDDLPWLDSGKVDRRAVADLLAADTL